MAKYPNGYHCFSCGKTELVNTGIKEKPKENKTLNSLGCLYYDLNLYENQASYLESYGITEDTIKKFGICCTTPHTYIESESGKYFIGEGIAYPLGLGDYQIRLLDTRKMKYYNYGEVDKLFWALGSAEKKSEVVEIILVEDCVSAMKLAQSGYDAVSLLGTKLSNRKVLELTANIKTPKFIVWLDSDNPGQTAAEKIQKTLSLFGPVYNITTPEDPKNYNESEIDEILGDIINNE
jgi:DNA primase